MVMVYKACVLSTISCGGDSLTFLVNEKRKCNEAELSLVRCELSPFIGVFVTNMKLTIGADKIHLYRITFIGLNVRYRSLLW